MRQGTGQKKKVAQGKRLGALALAAFCALLPGCGATAVLPENAPAVPAAAVQPATPESARGTQPSAGGQKLLLTALLETYLTQAEGATPETGAIFQELLEPEEETLSDSAAEALTQFCEAQPGSMSVWLEDLETGESFGYNTDTLYYTASTLKAPYALWLCQRADAGEFSLADEVPNLYRGSLAGSRMEAYNDSPVLPIRVAMEAMIADSDNDATVTLMAAYPGTAEEGFPEFLAELGFSMPEVCAMVTTGIQGYATVEDGADVMRALYAYFASDAQNAAALKEMFCAATHKMLYIPEGVETAKKYGSWDAAFHDQAIVYAEHPYLLCCYTDWGNAEVDYPPEAVERMQQLGVLCAEAMCAE